MTWQPPPPWWGAQRFTRQDPEVVIGRTRIYPGNVHYAEDANDGMSGDAAGETREERYARENAEEILRRHASHAGMGDLGLGAGAGFDPQALLGAAAGAVPGLIRGSAGDLLGAAVRRVTIKSQIAPTVTYTPGAPGQPAHAVSDGTGGEGMMALIRPEIEMETPAGTVNMAPYGHPEPGRYFWPAVLVLAGGSAVVLWLTWRGLMSLLGRRG